MAYITAIKSVSMENLLRERRRCLLDDSLQQCVRSKVFHVTNNDSREDRCGMLLNLKHLNHFHAGLYEGNETSCWR